MENQTIMNEAATTFAAVNDTADYRTPKKKKGKGKQVSTLNWMLTILVMLIPGVNVLCAILFVIFGKSPSKRNFGMAWLTLAILLTIAVAVLLMLYPDRAMDLADRMREIASPSATPPVWA